MALRIIAATYVVLALVSAPEAHADDRDKAVFRAALAHFTKRGDTNPYHANGIILIEPRTRTWQREWLDILADNPPRGCLIGRTFYSRLIERNQTEHSADELVLDSHRWRKSRPAEEKMSFLTSRTTPTGEPVRTRIELSAPAYSPSGDLAFVTFEFAWSIHGAVAEYMMKRSSKGWMVQCSKLLFMV